jgi:signal transduction histidine kinase
VTRRARLLDGTLVAGYLLLVLLLFATHDGDPSDRLAAARVATGLVAAAALAVRRRHPAWLLAAAVLDGVVGSEVSAALPFAAYAAVRYGDARSRWVALAAAALVALAPWQFGDRAEAVNNLLVVVGLALLPAVLAAWVRTRAELVVALRQRAERAEAEQHLRAREAVLAERARIAREMHDVVGHRVSLMVLQAGAIDMAAEDAARVRVLAGQLEGAGRRSLAELRQLLGLLADGDAEDAPLAPQPGLADLAELVADAARAGMAVTLTRGGTGAVEETVGRTAYRVVQEALTNAGKHAPGGAVTVTLDRGPDALVVTVLNRAATRPPAGLPGGGLGLIGLRERTRTVGGTLRAEPRLDGGFGVEAVLPC